MVTFDFLRQVALSFPEVTEMPHFEKASFRIRKKIFATYDARTGLATLKLSSVDQDIFSVGSEHAICPVPNKWAHQGWTLVELKKVKQRIFKEALLAAYCAVAPAKLVDLIRGH